MNTHGICEVARRGEPCTVCHAIAGESCRATGGGIHLCRICLAASHGLITMLDEASVIPDSDGIAGTLLVLAPEVAA